MNGGEKIRPAADGRQIVGDKIFCRRDTMLGIKLLLQDLVLDRAEGRRLRIDLYAFSLELFQGFFVDGFYFDGQRLQIFPEPVDVIEIPDIPFDKMMTQVSGRAVLVIFHQVGFDRIVGRCLQ